MSFNDVTARFVDASFLTDSVEDGVAIDLSMDCYMFICGFQFFYLLPHAQHNPARTDLGLVYSQWNPPQKDVDRRIHPAPKVRAWAKAFDHKNRFYAVFEKPRGSGVFFSPTLQIWFELPRQLHKASERIMQRRLPVPVLPAGDICPPKQLTWNGYTIFPYTRKGMVVFLVIPPSPADAFMLAPDPENLAQLDPPVACPDLFDLRELCQKTWELNKRLEAFTLHPDVMCGGMISRRYHISLPLKPGFRMGTR
jgi:hypothetical protein